jgi:hypothetical protein
MGTAALALRGRGTAPTGHCDRRGRADEDGGMVVLGFSQADIRNRNLKKTNNLQNS